MELSGRGWKGATSAKPAMEYEIRYGTGLLRCQSSGWPPYAVVSSPRAHRTAAAHLERPPAAVVHADSLDFEYLQTRAESLPDEAELLVGVGGGLALDAAKYAALARKLPLVLVPTVVSTGAIIHSMFARWEGRQIIGGVEDWPWVDPDYVLVDYGLALEAPPYLHCAGLGDILCSYAGVAEWRWRRARGRGPAVEEKVVADYISYHEKMVREFAQSLDAGGHLTAASIHCIMRRLHERDDRNLPQPAAASGDHPLLHVLELVNDSNWVHGEVVALAALIITWHCGDDHRGLQTRLDRCQVRHRPVQMGLSREQLLRGLEAAPDYMERMGIDSILRHEPLVGERFVALWKFLQKD